MKMDYREVFKVIVGAAAWDGIVALWFIVSGLYPVDFFGIPFGLPGLVIALAADIIIVIIFSYFAWNNFAKKAKAPSRKKPRKNAKRKR